MRIIQIYGFFSRKGTLLNGKTGDDLPEWPNVTLRTQVETVSPLPGNGPTHLYTTT